MKKFILIALTVQMFPVTSCQLSAQAVSEPIISESVFFFESIPIREMTIVLPGDHNQEPWIAPNRFPKFPETPPGKDFPDEPQVVQNTIGHRMSRGPVLNFEGVGNLIGGSPADPNGDVGTDHYVQTVNNAFAVWDKNGNLLYGPVHNKTIFQSLPGPFNSYYWSDPVFKYDHLADRWVMISMCFKNNDFYTMVAVSVSPDPMDSYYCYAYQFTDWNDYPKVSVWPDGYYLTHNFWHHITDLYMYTLYCVVDREAMLNGAPVATMIQFQVLDPGEGLFFPMPSDMRGTEVPANAPCYFVIPGRPDPGNPWDLTLEVHALNTNWNTPSSSTFQNIASFDIGQFVPVPYPYGPGTPQLGSSINVMTIPMYMMYPLTYRMFSDHETMVCCHTMMSEEAHFIKWYELRKEDAGWYLYQTGNYAPDSLHYFIPSISVNSLGDIALAYTACSGDMYPATRYTGRKSGDPTGVMTLQELELYKGLNYANTFDPGYEQNRWGDYSSMMVDPSDDTTFWFTNMYTTSSSSPGNWSTRIFSLSLSGEPLTPVAFAGNDTVVPNVVFFNTQGHAENYSSLVWTTSGDGIFITNNSENSTYLRGPGDLENQQFTLTMSLTGYVPGFSASDSMTVYLLPVGITALETEEIRLRAFPNPATTSMTITAESFPGEYILMEIISADGRQVFTGRYISDNHQFTLPFDVSYLRPGIYIVRMATSLEPLIKSCKLVVSGR